MTYAPQADYYYSSYPVGHSAYIKAPEPAAVAPAPATIAWNGPTKAEVDARNYAMAEASGATKPRQLVPLNSSPTQQYYVRELDGSYTLRTAGDIHTNLTAGYWQYHPESGYPYYVVQK